MRIGLLSYFTGNYNNNFSCGLVTFCQRLQGFSLPWIRHARSGLWAAHILHGPSVLYWFLKLFSNFCLNALTWDSKCKNVKCTSKHKGIINTYCAATWCLIYESCHTWSCVIASALSKRTHLTAWSQPEKSRKTCDFSYMKLFHYDSTCSTFCSAIFNSWYFYLELWGSQGKSSKWHFGRWSPCE